MNIKLVINLKLNIYQSYGDPSPGRTPMGWFGQAHSYNLGMLWERDNNCHLMGGIVHFVIGVHSGGR